MSLADDKRDVFNKIGAYTSLIEAGDVPEQTDLFPSINNKDDIIPFILDVLKTVAGTVVLKEAIGKLFTEVLDESEPQIKSALKKQFVQGNASASLPTTFRTNGITIPLKQLDVSGKFRVDPLSQGGQLIYGDSGGFDTAVHNAILNAGNPINYENLVLTYNDGTDEIQIKPNSSYGGNTGDFFADYINNVELIDKSIIISSVLNAIYGTLSKDQNKTVEQQYEEEKTNVLLNNVLNDDDSFVISPSDLSELQNRAENVINGTLEYDLGCGMMPVELSMDDLSTISNSILDSSDPYFISNEFEKTIDDSTSGDTETQDLTEENRETIKDGFFQKLINVFTTQLLAMVTTAPQIRVLFGMQSAIENNGTVLLSKASDDMKYFKTCIKCMSKEIMKIIAGFLFTLAITYLVKLLKPVVTRVLKEKINQYVGLIKSLTGINKVM